jgi:hypothetical protein
VTSYHFSVELLLSLVVLFLFLFCPFLAQSLTLKNPIFVIWHLLLWIPKLPSPRSLPMCLSCFFYVWTGRFISWRWVYQFSWASFSFFLVYWELLCKWVFSLDPSVWNFPSLYLNFFPNIFEIRFLKYKVYI